MTVKEYFEKDKFAYNNGIELLEAKNGYAKARLKITPAHLNAGGVCQGGAIFTLADFAFAVACNSHSQLTFSINSSINIFRSQSEGVLYAEAREVFNHPKLSNCEVEVKNEAGELIATFTGTGFRKAHELPFEALK